LAVAVPGELKGYWELYTTHGGGVPWSRIVEPTAKMCKEGFPVSYHTANALRGAEAGIKAEPTMAEVYINKSTGNVFQLNDTITRPVLGQTLEKIGAAPTGGNILYEADSELMQLFVADLAAMNGIITEEDMTNYS
jgi:gamma-glutamyltranspeptidase/glutathione hydrolase/leukotriene-C4 hydrolase